MIFVDSDALIGIVLPKDAHHGTALAMLDALAQSQEELATSWECIDEVATKLSMYHNKKVARDFLNYVYETSRLTIRFVDAALSREALVIFDKQTSKNVSLTDCANIAICRSMGIRAVFSFDLHYKKNGLKLLSYTAL